MNKRKKQVTTYSLISRGWDEKMINQLLPSPTKKYDEKHRKMRCFWYEKDVIQAEQSKEFQTYLNKTKQKEKDKKNRSITLYQKHPLRILPTIIR